MLTPDQAASRLASQEIPDWHDRLTERLGRLPDDLRCLGAPFRRLDGPRQGMLRRPDCRQKLDAGLRRLDAMAAQQRRAYFEALLPKAADTLERAWQLGKTLPYHVMFCPGSFRAPHDPLLTLQTRFFCLWSLACDLGKYDPDARWVAAWAPYVYRYGDEQAAGRLLAAAIDAGGPDAEEVFKILCDSADGTHPIGTMGRHVIHAFLMCSRPDAWGFLEKMLLDARREEGLRWAVLEAASHGHPGAFRRLVQAILDHDLIRFSAVTASIASWLGMVVTAGDGKEGKAVDIRETLHRLLAYLDDPAARQEGLDHGECWEVYLALWTAAFEDIDQAIEPAARLLKEGDFPRRQLALEILSQINVPRTDEILVYALDDPDLRLAAQAVISLASPTSVLDAPPDAFERVERLAQRLPRRRMQPESIAPGGAHPPACGGAVAAVLVKCLGDRPAARLAPYVPLMNPRQRVEFIWLVGQVQPLDAPARQALLGLAADRNRRVQEEALAMLARDGVPEADFIHLEGCLSAGAGSARLGLIQFLLGRPDEQVLASARRLLEARSAQQRLAGLELLRQLVGGNRCVAAARQIARRFHLARPRLSEEEARHLEAIAAAAGPAAASVGLAHGLGLVDTANLVQPLRPVKRDVKVVTVAAEAFLEALDEFIDQHREVPVTLSDAQVTHQEMLGNLTHGFPQPDANDNDPQRLPLRDLWEDWWQRRDPKTRDADGFEFIRGMFLLETIRPQPRGLLAQLWQQVLKSPRPKWRYPDILRTLLLWFVRLHSQRGEADFLLDGLETTLADTPPRKAAAALSVAQDDDEEWWPHVHMRALWLGLIRAHQQFFPQDWSPEQRGRLWRLLLHADRFLAGSPFGKMRIEDVLAAYHAGAAGPDDILAHLMMVGEEHPERMFGLMCHDLHRLSGRTPDPLLKDHPYLAELVDRCRRRIVEVELQRGESPTPATPLALGLRYVGGADVLIRVLQGLGNEKIGRGSAHDEASRARVFTHLIEATAPLPTDSPEEFAARTRAAGVTSKRLLQVAMLAPQWASHVERAVGWEGLAEAVWWIHAHTRPAYYRVEQDMQALWTAHISCRTPISGEDLADGAADPAWFHRAYEQLGEVRWEQLDEWMPITCDANNHTRARLYADALRGRLDREGLFERIRQKRHQDSVRAVGLLPLAAGGDGRKDLLDRYNVLQEFRRGSHKFGAQRQVSEQRAVEIAMQNLARVAGYPDPLRLEWAMEIESLADLAAGPVKVAVGLTEAALSIDEQGHPQMTFTKAGRTLKSVPAALNNSDQFKALQERKAQLRRQSSRTRASLETSMCRGDVFSGRELQDLCRHPVLAPMLARLVVIGEGIRGYPVDGGRGLQDHAARIEPVRADEKLRIAHPLDLLATDEWHLWQRDCFSRERVQPFKQVFRELYILTEGEKEDGGRVSHRYAGQQVEPRKAAALLGGRQWLIHHDAGVQRTFHEEGITACLTSEADWLSYLGSTSITLGGVHFSRRHELEPVPLEQVPPRIFSEVMRDLDLVVSVAHAGGVDPEASSSTRQMRAALVQETCHLLQLPNVRVQGSHVLIDGQLGHYNVHLGSGVVHRQPGGMLFIVPVHNQHRGRLFLPFADDDPKTAEVVSKVILLARDTDIKDPTILEQIRG